MEDVLPGLDVTDGQRRLVDGGGGDRAGSGSRSQLDKVEPGDAEEVALLLSRWLGGHRSGGGGGCGGGGGGGDASRASREERWSLRGRMLRRGCGRGLVVLGEIELAWIRDAVVCLEPAPSDGVVVELRVSETYTCAVRVGAMRAGGALR
ncbi:hypothetical protein L1887_53412 [Cichorium endivia]|nr:hypothetical protein L1887_53412 [Cichorium endivia]